MTSSVSGQSPSDLQNGVRVFSIHLPLNEHRRAPAASGPDLHGHHGLLGADGWKQVLFRQELKRKLNEEATDLLQLLLSPSRVLFVQAGLGQVALQLHYVTDVAGWQTAENLEEQERNRSLEQFFNVIIQDL